MEIDNQNIKTVQPIGIMCLRADLLLMLYLTVLMVAYAHCITMISISCICAHSYTREKEAAEKANFISRRKRSTVFVVTSSGKGV